MAKEDLFNYYIQVKEDYLEMIDNLKEWERELNDKLISPELYQEKVDELNDLKENYFRIAYIMHLYNKPGEPQRGIHNLLKKVFKVKNPKFDWDGPDNASLEAVKEENRKILDNMDL